MARKFIASSNEFINLGHGSQLDIKGKTITMSAWVNIASTTAEKKVFGKWDGGSGFTISYLLTVTGAGNNNPLFAITNSIPSVEVIGASSNITTGGWHHVAGVRDGAALLLDIYLDGVKTSGAAANQNIQSVAGIDVLIGAGGLSLPTTVNWMDGSIADTAVWNVALTAAEIIALSNGARPWTIRTASLMGWWPLDGLQSPEPDFSGFVNNGTLTGTALASGPPVMQFTPRWPQFLTPAAPTFNPGWAIGRNYINEGVAS